MHILTHTGLPSALSQLLQVTPSSTHGGQLASPLSAQGSGGLSPADGAPGEVRRRGSATRGASATAAAVVSCDGTVPGHDRQQQQRQQQQQGQRQSLGGACDGPLAAATAAHAAARRKASGTGVVVDESMMRWVPYKHANGMAIYYRQTPQEEGRGMPQGCLLQCNNASAGWLADWLASYLACFQTPHSPHLTTYIDFAALCLTHAQRLLPLVPGAFIGAPLACGIIWGVMSTPPALTPHSINRPTPITITTTIVVLPGIWRVHAQHICAGQPRVLRCCTHAQDR